MELWINVASNALPHNLWWPTLQDGDIFLDSSRAPALSAAAGVFPRKAARELSLNKAGSLLTEIGFSQKGLCGTLRGPRKPRGGRRRP